MSGLVGNIIIQDNIVLIKIKKDYILRSLKQHPVYMLFNAVQIRIVQLHSIVGKIEFSKFLFIRIK